MSETEVKEVVDLEEQKNAVNKDAEAPETTHLKMTLRIWVHQ
jgi:hypothetical protein